MQKLDFIEWAETSGYSKLEVPMNVMTAIMQFSDYAESKVNKLHIPKCYAPLFKERRIKLGLSMQDVTDKTGVSKSTISRLERGEEPLHKTVIALDDFYSFNGA